jgi:hypothetical protein
VAAQSKAWTVFARSNTEIVGSNPNQGMEVCIYSELVLPCVGSGFATGWTPAQRVPPTVWGSVGTRAHTAIQVERLVSGGMSQRVETPLHSSTFCVKMSQKEVLLTCAACILKWFTDVLYSKVGATGKRERESLYLNGHRFCFAELYTCVYLYAERDVSGFELRCYRITVHFSFFFVFYLMTLSVTQRVEYLDAKG